MAKITDPVLPILSIWGYRAIILGSAGGTDEKKDSHFGRNAFRLYLCQLREQAGCADLNKA